MMVSFKTCMHVFILKLKDFVIPVYIFNGRKQTQVDTSGYCQRCACVVCMTSTSSWPNCVSRVARIGSRLFGFFVCFFFLGGLPSAYTQAKNTLTGMTGDYNHKFAPMWTPPKWLTFMSPIQVVSDRTDQQTIFHCNILCDPWNTFQMCIFSFLTFITNLIPILSLQWTGWRWIYYFSVS